MRDTVREFLQQISSITGLDNVDNLGNVLTSRSYKKGDTIVQPGSIADSIYFVFDGVLRTFLLKDGKEITTEFFFSRSFAGAFTSYLRQKPTALNIVAVTDTVLIVLKKKILDQLACEDLRWTLISKYIFEIEFVKKCERESSFLLEDAAGRYRTLLEQRPDIETVIPLSVVASYLRIEPETLSRLGSQKFRA